MQPACEMKNIPTSDTIQRAADLILSSSSIVVFTGAGISTPSGIPDFRSANNGLWTQSNPMEVASLTAFHHHPEKFFNWLRPLAAEIWKAAPNGAHYGLVELEKAGFLRAVITQNIDGLHRKAGSSEVVEVHGSMVNLECEKCRAVFSASDFLDPFIKDGIIPTCRHCTRILKPGIILFEEMLPYAAWTKAVAHSQNADLFIVIGSSLEVTPAASLPLEALRSGARLIINTRSGTYLDSRADVLIHQDVAEVIPAITRMVIESITGRRP